MPKQRTNPILYNDVKKLSVSDLKKWGYLEFQIVKKGTVNWKIYNDIQSSISIEVDTKETPHIKLSYKFRGVVRAYNVELISIKSNLNKGQIWYFVCPKTKKQCRKLYLVNGYFFHREAFNGCMYENQTLSKENRDSKKILNSIFEAENFLGEIEKKHLKKSYAGKPTKKYLQLLEKVKEKEKLFQKAIKI